MANVAPEDVDRQEEQDPKAMEKVLLFEIKFLFKLPIEFFIPLIILCWNCTSERYLLITLLED